MASVGERPGRAMEEPGGKFADVLRQLRSRARLTQDELAHRAGVSFRTVSDLERGRATTPQKETVRLLADALRLIARGGPEFGAGAGARPRRRGPKAAVAAAPALRSLPRDVASFTGRQ